MRNFKRRVISGAVVLLCLLTSLSNTAWLPDNDNTALAETTPAPDLIIESVSLLPETPSIGDTITFTVTIKNLGDIQTGASQLTCFIDEQRISTGTIVSIYPGMVVIKIITQKGQAGSHVFRAVIDINNRVAESDETNNDKSYAYSVLAPDLAIDAISWTPVNPAVGDKVTFTVTIINQGDKRAGVSHLDFSIDGSSRSYLGILGIEPKASVNETFTWMATPGVHNIKAATDILYQVTESDEANNTSEATCATVEPDLIISSITVSPENIAENTTITFSVNIKNQGGSQADPSSVTFYIEDSQKDSEPLSTLEPDAITTANFTWIAGKNPFTFRATVDAYNQIIESDETNNSKTVTLSQLYPDLVIQNITWSPSNPLINDFVSFTITTKNQGKSTSGPTELTFSIDNGYFFTDIIPALTVNATAISVFNFMTRSYSHSAKAFIDEDNVVQESDESNNTLTKTVTSVNFTPSADLILETLTCSPAKPVIGETVNISLRVKNQGTGTATPSYAEIYFDRILMDSVYINQLEAGAALTKDVPLSLQGLPFQDTYKVKVFLDSHYSVPETDELNNKKEISFSISYPDLVIQLIRWSPELPAAGDTVNFDVTVKNHGDLKAGSTYISYYVDDAFTGQHRIEDISGGTTVTRSFIWTAKAEAFSFSAVIDEDDEINESDESNNTKAVHLPAPDLFIDTVTWSPANPPEFLPLTFTAVIGNRGYGRSAGTVLSCVLDGTTPLSTDIGEISPGDTTPVAFTYNFLSGEHTVRLVADGTDTIVESNEANNEKTIKFTVPSFSDNLTTAPDSANITTVMPPENGTAATIETGENITSENTTLPQAPGQDTAANITSAPPFWQGILQNSWIISGTAALGIAAIGLLLLFRKKTKKS